MTAEIVSVGTELLFGQIVDTNAQYLGQVFPTLGITHLRRQTVGDNLERLTEALKLALSRSDVVVTIGGLGPTDDDLTRDGIAAALGDSLILDDDLEEVLREKWRVRKLPWTTAQTRQSYRPDSGRGIPNPNGSAPGLICEKNGKIVIALPGPKGEFIPMVDGPVTDFLRSRGDGSVIHSHLMRICGLGESMVEERIRHLLDSSNPTVAPYAQIGEVHLRVSARASSVEEAEALIAPFEQKIRDVLGNAIYATGSTPIEAAVLEMMRSKRLTLSVAESISGGGLGERITAIAGASDVFLGGVIAYASTFKAKLLGVDESLLNDPVSTEVAQQMALGARKLFESDYAVSLTGNAGPSVDAGGKPVGLVYLSVAGPKGVEVQEYRMVGRRDDIRRRSTQFALTMLRDELL